MLEKQVCWNLIVPPEIYILLVIIFPLSPPTSQSSVFVHLGQTDFRFGEAEITSTSGLEEAFRTGFMFGLVLECSMNDFLQLSFHQLRLRPPLSIPSIWLEWGSPHDSSGSGITATGVAARISHDPLWYHSVWCLTYTFTVLFFLFVFRQCLDFCFSMKIFSMETCEIKLSTSFFKGFTSEAIILTSVTCSTFFIIKNTDITCLCLEPNYQ